MDLHRRIRLDYSRASATVAFLGFAQERSPGEAPIAFLEWSLVCAQAGTLPLQATRFSSDAADREQLSLWVEGWNRYSRPLSLSVGRGAPAFSSASGPRIVRTGKTDAS